MITREELEIIKKLSPMAAVCGPRLDQLITTIERMAELLENVSCDLCECLPQYNQECMACRAKILLKEFEGEK